MPHDEPEALVAARLPAEPEALLAARLVERAGAADLVFVARDEARAARLNRAARALAADDLSVLSLPAWDCLPYDRVSPSRGVMGQRMATAAALAARPGGGERRPVLASAEFFGWRLGSMDVRALPQVVPLPTGFRWGSLSERTKARL